MASDLKRIAAERKAFEHAAALVKHYRGECRMQRGIIIAETIIIGVLTAVIFGMCYYG